MKKALVGLFLIVASVGFAQSDCPISGADCGPRFGNWFTGRMGNLMDGYADVVIYYADLEARNQGVTFVNRNGITTLAITFTAEMITALQSSDAPKLLWTSSSLNGIQEITGFPILSNAGVFVEDQSDWGMILTELIQADELMFRAVADGTQEDFTVFNGDGDAARAIGWLIQRIEQKMGSQPKSSQ